MLAPTAGRLRLTLERPISLSLSSPQVFLAHARGQDINVLAVANAGINPGIADIDQQVDNYER